jgi:serine/threonine protein kinase
MHEGPSQLVAGVREGEVIDGKYRVERVLGTGGMGVVVAARHIQLDQRVALKFLLPDALGDERAVARFVREARAAVKINSEHVARVTDVGTLDSGAPYIVMEYLEGGDLAAWLKQRGALPIAQAVEFVLQASVAVAEAHGLGIVHRDLKPANLFCIRRADGQLSVKVLDFGISKRTDMTGTDAMPAMTMTGALMGSPLYMSPEQMRSSKDVGAATDIWALGIILFELIAGRPPFLPASVTEIAIKVANDPIPSIQDFRPEVPAELEAVIRKCLEKEARQRYRNVGELALALLPFAPKRAKASVERISGIIQAFGLSDSALAVPPTPQVDETKASGGTLPPVGRTIGAGRARSVLLRAGLTGTVVAIVGAASIVLFNKPHVSPDDLQPGASPSVTTSIVPPKVVAIDPPKPAEIDVVPAPATASALAPSALSASAPSKPWKPTKTVPTAPTASATTAAPTPDCTIVTNYDGDGQPHFKKVCK